MIHVSKALSPSGELLEFSLESPHHLHIQADNLVLLPGLIDPHVHFRTPGLEYKEDWRTAAQAAIHGGYTTVFDMPNTLPPTITQDLLLEKKSLIDSQLAEVGIPLRYQLFFGADKSHLNEIPKVKNEAIGIKVFMGCSTGNLVIDDDDSLEAVFALAAEHDMLVAVHAEDESRLCSRKLEFKDSQAYSDHSLIRDIEAARLAVEKAINLTRKYGTRLYILHVSSEEEIDLIRDAKAEGLPVYAETTPHHLFLNDEAYASIQGRAVVNPPLRAAIHNEVLFEAINTGVIDTIGSDHAPHTQEEKARPYGSCPSGMPGIETTLPLLLTAYHEGKLSLKRIIDLTSLRAQTIFRLPPTQDFVLVDLDCEREVDPQQLKTKCAWSAFSGRVLKGWPAYTLLQGECFKLR